MQKVLCLLSLLFIGGLYAQTSDKYNSVYAPFYKAEDLFLKEQYGAAREEFKLFQKSYQQANDPLFIKARYYEGLSALELFQNDGVTLLESFNRDYPESIYRTTIYFRLGKYYYQKKDYPQTIEWFNKLATVNVDPEELDEFHFKLGYAYFEEKNNSRARTSFYEVKDSPSQYGVPSLYYYSHIEYLNGSFQTALEGFLKLKNDPNYSKIVPYYIAQIYYQQEKYEDVISYVPNVMDSIGVANEKGISILIGDSYYRLGKYAEALPYLEKYNRLSETTRENDYQLGFTYYKTGSYRKAIAYLAKATGVDDALGQIAMYQIGESYLQLGENLPARNAFEKAAESSQDVKISEDAAYQFAVLSYKSDLNPYDEALVAFESYLNKYPDSKRKNEVYQYLVNVYASTNNYGKALESLEKLPTKDIRMRSAYQLIAYNAGVEQYQKKNFTQAIAFFEKVEKYPIDQNLTAKAAFWTGDAYFQKEEYRKSIQNYRVFLTSPSIGLNSLKNDSYYNIGYAQLELRDTSAAIESFKLFTQQGKHADRKKLSDGYMRIGDCSYATRQNDAAVKAYREVVRMKAGYEDQALHYLGKTLGYMNQVDEKIWAHKEILTKYPKSKYVQIAIQELAVSYKTKAAYDEALRYYQQIVSEYPNSGLVVEAMIEIADIYYKKQEYLKAESKYKEVLAKYSGDRLICETCAKNLMDVYRTMREPERLQRIIEEYPCTNLSPDDQENLYYGPAYELYRDSNYVQAIPQIKKYLEKYPSGKYASEMKVFLGNSHFGLNEIDLAMAAYNQVLESNNNGYTEFVAQRVSKYYYNRNDYALALPAYRKLETVSSIPEVIYNSQLGIMRCSFLLENWAEAAVNATKVLSNSQVNNTIRLEAQYAKGISSYRLEQWVDAVPALEYLVKNTTTVLGAEAKFTLASIAFKQNDLDKTDIIVRELLKMKPSYNYWVAKGLLLQSKALMIKGDLFQAEQ
ncbi:MAG: tetratricopeptide repeat protein, partial [Bacteroidetes bacterium]|nr:tetratricopeptide repeat protein [Bacteroidota bacterium]